MSARHNYFTIRSFPTVAEYARHLEDLENERWEFRQPQPIRHGELPRQATMSGWMLSKADVEAAKLKHLIL